MVKRPPVFLTKEQIPGYFEVTDKEAENLVKKLRVVGNMFGADLFSSEDVKEALA